MLYNLENLSWQEFETLAKYYLKEKIGEGLWVFDGSQDMGRDAAFKGTANEFPSKTAPYNGDWIFQAKHRTTRGKTEKQAEKELLDTLYKELDKIFVKHKLTCDNYVYITNLNVSNQFRQNAQRVFNKFCSDNALSNINFNVIEYKDFEVFISNNQAARFSFPSLLTFRDLGKTFLRKEEIKNVGYINFALGEISKFVSTAQYIEAVKRIIEYDILMLVGNPKSGKTSIVDALAIYFLQEGKYKPYFIKNTDEFFTYNAYLSENESALFICDDIFGTHELDHSKLKDWTDYFQSILGLVQHNRKFLFTTRQYIYEEFANKSGLRNFFPKADDPTRHVLKLGELTGTEREQIVDKHLLTSDLSSEATSLVLSHKEEILNCKDFSPEVVRSLVALLRKTNLSDIPGLIFRHISNPNQYLFDFFSQISKQKQLLLLAIATSPSLDMNDVEKTYLAVLSDANEKPQTIFQTFIDELDRSLIKKRTYLNASEIEYYHPSMFEVVFDICKQDKHYRGLMLSNTNLDIIYLLTLKKPMYGSIKISIELDEFGTLASGIGRLLGRSIGLHEISRLITWINLFTPELPYQPSSIKHFGKIKALIRTSISQPDFYAVHQRESIDNWIRILDKWSLIGDNQTFLTYSKDLESSFRDYKSYDYWRLVFLMEHLEQGFINRVIPQNIVNEFSKKLGSMAKGLRLGLNLTAQNDKPRTDEEWYPLFRELDDLIIKMKKSNTGNQIIEREVITEWQQVKRHSEFAKNRHSGMVLRGHWKSFKPIRNFHSLTA